MKPRSENQLKPTYCVRTGQMIAPKMRPRAARHQITERRQSLRGSGVLRSATAYPQEKKRAKVPEEGPEPSGPSSGSRASGSGDAPTPIMPLPPLPRGSMADAVLQHGAEEGDVIHEGYHREVFIPWVWIHSPEARGVLHFGSVGDPSTPLCSQHKTGAAPEAQSHAADRMLHVILGGPVALFRLIL